MLRLALSLLAALAAFPVDAAHDLNGSSQYLINTASVFGDPYDSAMPVSGACWINADTPSGGAETIYFYGSSADSNDRAMVTISGADATAGDTIQVGASEADSNDWNSALTTASVSADTWMLVGWVHASTSSRTATLNGANTGTNTDTVALGGGGGTHDNLCFGRQCDSSPNWYFDGEVGPCGLWDVALTVGNFASLYNSGSGANLDTVQGGNLVHCYDMNSATSTESDLVGSADLTVTGSPTQTAGPGVQCLTAASGVSAAILRHRHSGKPIAIGN